MKKILVLIFAFIAFANVSFAQTTQKIGYTNLDYILRLLPEAKQIESELMAHEKQLKNQMDSKIAEYEKKLAEYQRLVQSNMVTDVVKQDKEKELIGMQNSIKEFEENAQTSMQNKQIQLLEPVLDKIQKAIEKVADANGFSYILQTHADISGSAIILYAKNKEDDISNLVLKELGVTPPPIPDMSK